jgi:hypothetical protein
MAFGEVASNFGEIGNQSRDGIYRRYEDRDGIVRTTAFNRGDARDSVAIERVREKTK